MACDLTAVLADELSVGIGLYDRETQ